jgi:uncharacterized membrane protein YbhN (UPF0104 family)
MRRPSLRARIVAVALAAAVLAVAIVAIVYRGPDWATVGDSFAAVNWTWVAVALGFNLLSIAARSMAWKTVIDQAIDPPRPGYRPVFSAFCVGLLGNAVLPGRIGEVARVAVLSRRLGRRKGVWASLIGTVFAHRVFDLVPVMALIAFVLVTAQIPQWAVTSLKLVVAVGLVLFLIAFLIATRRYRSPLDGLGPVRRLVTMARQGLAALHEPVAAAIAVAFQFIGWGLQLLAVYSAMQAFEIHEPLAAAGLVLVLMNVATVFPLWPGNVGLVQAAVALPLVSYGVAYAHGFAFGIGLQAIEASVGIGLGMVFLAREGLSYAMLKEIPEPTEVELESHEPGPRTTIGSKLST